MSVKTIIEDAVVQKGTKKDGGTYYFVEVNEPVRKYMQRLQNNKKIVKESEILHMLIDFAFKNSEIKDGEIVIKNSFLQE